MMNGKVDYRVKQVVSRINNINKKRADHLIAGLWLGCIMLVMCISQAFNLAASSTYNGATIVDEYGAVLMLDFAGAYVLTGVLSFTSGVVLTILCIRLKNKKNHSK